MLYFKAELYLLHDFIHSYRNCILIQITILILYPQANAFNCSALAESSVMCSILGCMIFKNIQSVHLWIQSWQCAWEQHCSPSRANLNDLV